MGSAVHVKRQGAVLVLIEGILCVAFGVALGGYAFISAVSASIAALIFFIAVSYRRHKEILHLSAEIDEVLHGSRQVAFSHCKEGDVAILENELSKMVARLSRTRSLVIQEKNALADALADISHQIRTPLTSIGLMLPLIERAQEELERKRLVRELESMLDRVFWLVSTLLKLAKVDAGAMPIERNTVLVTDMLERALAPLTINLDLHDITLHTELDAHAQFEGDELWSAEAVENIIKNCIEHTPVGGSIMLQTTTDAIATRIVIEDSGPGIAPEDLPHIFDRFYRGGIQEEAQEFHNPQGFGVGLALAHALVGAQGASLQAANGTRGARFEIVYPKFVV